MKVAAASTRMLKACAFEHFAPLFHYITHGCPFFFIILLMKCLQSDVNLEDETLTLILRDCPIIFMLTEEDFPVKS